MTQRHLAIKASGLVTAVGFNAPASCAAIRGGISGAREANLWDPEAGAWLNAAKVDLRQWSETLEKLADLVAPAINECLQAASPTPPESIPLLLGVPGPDRPYRFDGIDDELLALIEERLELPHHPVSQIIARDRVSGVAGLAESLKLLCSDIPPRLCIVAGVDSFLRQVVVEAYIDRRRVLTANNSNGFIPGEAGSAVLVGPSAGEAGELLVVGMCFAQEPYPIESDRPSRSEGLVGAVRGALQAAGATWADLDHRLTDLNGEEYKFKEATNVTFRLDRGSAHRGGALDIAHPTEYVGEIGAAIGPCLLAVALDAGRKGYGPGPLILHHFSNDDGERAAIVTRYQESSR